MYQENTAVPEYNPASNRLGQISAGMGNAGMQSKAPPTNITVASQFENIHKATAEMLNIADRIASAVAGSIPSCDSENQVRPAPSDILDHQQCHIRALNTLYNSLVRAAQALGV